MREIIDKTPATIELHTRKFLKTNNFSYAMSAFCQARENGHPIPEVILEYLEKSFLEWGRSDGERSLDEILGIKPGRGSKSSLTSPWKMQRDIELFFNMATLIGLGWNVSEAAEGACSWLQTEIETNPAKRKYLMPSNAGRREKGGFVLDAKTLADYWYDPKHQLQRKEGERRAKWPLAFWSEEEKANYQITIREFMGKI